MNTKDMLELLHRHSLYYRKHLLKEPGNEYVFGVIAGLEKGLHEVHQNDEDHSESIATALITYGWFYDLTESFRKTAAGTAPYRLLSELRALILQAVLTRNFKQDYLNSYDDPPVIVFDDYLLHRIAVIILDHYKEGITGE